MKITTVTGDPRALTLLDLNARYMRHEQFAALVANIKRDGALASAPFVWVNPEGDRIVLSGNHRTQAAIEAGISEITWLETDEPLTRQQRVAIQLSHNAIAGEDDPAILIALYEELTDLTARQYSGLDDRDLELMAEVTVGGLAEANLDYQTLSLTFLPDDAEQATNGMEEAKALSDSADQRWIARLEDHVRLLDAIALASATHDVRNMAAALAYVLDVFEAHRDDLQEGWYDRTTGEARHANWVPIVTILGNDAMPAPAAAIVTRAISKMADRGDVSRDSTWQALEAWAADYLAGG